MTAKKEVIEHFGGDFGVTVIFTLVEEYKAYVEFFAAEITARNFPDNAPLYWRKGAKSSEDDATDPHDAERYVAGSVKWDGCSHVTFGDENGYLHLCGWEHFDKLSTVLPQIYERCGELMKERGVNLLDDEFQCGPEGPTR